MVRYFKYYYKHKSGLSGKTPFTDANFKEANCYGESPVGGMPELEALRLVNKWNQNSHGWTYWL